MEKLTIQQMHGIGSLTDKDREDITSLIIEAIISNWNKDLEKEVCNGGVEATKIHLMKYPPLQKYPEYIVDHVLEINVERAGILNMIMDRPVLRSGKERATVIL